MTGLVRVLLRKHGEEEGDPLALDPPATVAEVARSIPSTTSSRRNAAAPASGGPSARFDGQRVGREHVLADGDAVENITRD